MSQENKPILVEILSAPPHTNEAKQTKCHTPTSSRITGFSLSHEPRIHTLWTSSSSKNKGKQSTFSHYCKSVVSKWNPSLGRRGRDLEEGLPILFPSAARHQSLVTLQANALTLMPTTKKEATNAPATLIDPDGRSRASPSLCCKAIWIMRF